MKLLIVLGVVSVASAMYGPGDDVVELTPSNFNNKVMQSDELWLVEFYAPWCGHCQSLAPDWKKAASALKGVVNVGAVDADSHQSLGGQYGVKGFPTIKIFGGNKNQPQDYQDLLKFAVKSVKADIQWNVVRVGAVDCDAHKGGPCSQFGVRGFPTIKVFSANKNSPKDYKGARSAQAIVSEAMSTLTSMVKDRLSGKKSGGSSGGSKSGGSGGSKQGDPADVIELTDSNFNEKVMGSEDMWLVEFFAPWCGHCKNLAPEWAKAASELKGKVKVAAVDATQETVLANRYGVRGYPTIKYFPAGKKSSDSVEDYDGGRTASDIVSWALDKHAESIPAPEIIQLTSQSVLTKACDDHQLCVISILPHILDCQSECRNNYIKVLSEMGEKYKKRMWGWVWAEGGAQPEVEQALGIGGFGYPAMAAVNSRKAKFAILKGAFSETGINEFLRQLALGRGSTAPLKTTKLPNVLDSEPWDGKDGELPVEEDIDLSDVELDDLDEDSKDEL